jgi:hypothetical protein
MPVRRLRALAIVLVGAIVATALSVVAAPQAMAANPNIIGPVGGENVQVIPNLRWERLPDAAKYDVQVSTSDTFASTLVNTSTVNSQYTPVVNLPAGDLWWRVRVTGSGEPGWSTAQFTRAPLDVPQMLGPTGLLKQPDTPPVISWTSVPGATQYKVQVSTDGTFVDTSKIINYTPVKTTTAINPVLSGPGTYYARVQAVLNGGLSTQFSSPISYTIDGLRAATPLSPAENGVVTDAVLDWAPVPGAATYQVQIDDDINFGSPVVDLDDITGTRYSPPKTIDNDTFYWRVRPVDDAGNARAWEDADRHTFQRAWPGQVHLEYPANGAVVGDPFYYQWSPSERTSSSQEDLALSSSYTLEVSTSSTFQGTVMRCDTVETTWIPQRSSTCWPGASGTYYWRVIGHDDWSGNRPATDAPSAEVHHFTYQPDVPAPISPVGGAHVTVPTLSWTPVPGAARYRVYINGEFFDTTAATSYTPHDILTPGTYSWQVQTVSQDNRLGTSFILDTASFVVDPMPTATGASPNPLNSPSGRRFPTLSWTAVAGASWYEVWAKPVANVGYTLIDDDFVYPAGESLDGTFLDPGDYDWFVNAFGTEGQLISSGSVGTFTINPLEDIPDDEQYAALAGTLLPDDPENADADLDADSCRTQILTADGQSECSPLRGTPVLRWAAKPNVGSYLLYVSHDQEMTNPVYDTNNDGVFTPITLTQPMWTPPDALPDSQAGTAYYYRVVPCSYQRCEALTHAQHSFDKESRKVVLKPAQYTPANGSAPVDCPPDSTPPNDQVCQNDVTLSWQDYRTTEKAPDADTPLQAQGRTEARSYIVQTATDPSFNGQIETVQVDQTTFTSFDTTYPEGPVYWRVRAVDGSLNLLSWSDTGVFIKRSPVPVLESPDGTSPVRGDLFLQWQALPFAAEYNIEVYRNHDTAANSANAAVTPATVQSRAVSLTNLLAQLPQMPNGDDPYVWRIRRIDAANRTGGWSDWGHFRVVEPAATQNAPAANASVPPSDALFTWTRVAGAESYRFERRLVGSSSLVEPVTTRALSWAPQQAIAGGNWEWRVTALDAAGNSLSPSDWRPFTVEDTVAATTAVVIGGSGQVGTPLTVTTPPAWNFGDTVTTSYQWYRGTTLIGGATGSTYIVTSADVGKSLTIKATGTRPGYLSGTSTSNGINGIAGNAPVAVTNVQISGTGKVGTDLTLTAPVWDNAETTTSYRWRRDGVDISGSTGSGTTYTVQPGDVGKQITVKATGTRTGYDPGASVSDPILGVAGDAPVASTNVTISGTNNKVGTTLTLTAPTWSMSGVSTTYQWFRDATPIPSATGTTYKLADADVGLSVTVRATGSKTGYTAGTSTSNAIVGAALDPIINTAAPTVSGVAAARETLRATTGTWQVTSGVSYAYQWFVDGVAVAKETKSSYVVRTIDAGKSVSVRVTATATGWAAGVATSGAMPVAKLASTTTATLAAKKITPRKRGVLTVKVAMLGYDVALGQIEVKDGSKVLTRTALATGKNGVVTIRLKKLKLGKHKLTITYLGSVATQSSVAKRVTLKVVKAL